MRITVIAWTSRCRRMGAQGYPSAAGPWSFWDEEKIWQEVVDFSEANVIYFQ